MKTSLRLLAAVFVLSFSGLVCAGDFVSQVVQGGVTPATFTIQVPAARFLVIRNFTQEGPTATITVRGTVTATDSTGLMGTVLTTTIVDTDPTL
jgi:hypothetical protein